MNANAFSQKDYDKEQRTINNERYSKQTQTKPISNATTVFLLITQEIATERQRLKELAVGRRRVPAKRGPNIYENISKLKAITAMPATNP